MAGLVKPEIARYRGAVSSSREEQPKSAASNWQDHAFTFINTSGELAECDGATPGNITKVYAIDTNRANATDIATRNVEPITSDNEILISVVDSAIPANGVTSQALVGAKFAIIKQTISGKDFWVLDISNTTDKIAEVTKIGPQYPVGELNGTVYIKILKSLLQYQP